MLAINALAPAVIDTRSAAASISVVDTTLTTSPPTRTASPLLTSTELPADTLTISELTVTDSPDVNSSTLAADTLTEPDPTARPKYSTALLHPSKLGLPNGDDPNRTATTSCRSKRT